jgi:hypothetical protein
MVKRGKKVWVGFDLGGTKMMATVYDASLQGAGVGEGEDAGERGAEGGAGADPRDDRRRR